MRNEIRILQEIQAKVAQEIIVCVAHGHISHSTVALSFFLFFLLCTACFSYTNLSIARL